MVKECVPPTIETGAQEPSLLCTERGLSKESQSLKDGGRTRSWETLLGQVPRPQQVLSRKQCPHCVACDALPACDCDCDCDCDWSGLVPGWHLTPSE